MHVSLPLLQRSVFSGETNKDVSVLDPRKDSLKCSTYWLGRPHVRGKDIEHLQ